jgi:glyoxylase-like metal-dependent hydrolase (beta-lactamase superfamily II)
MLRIHHLNCVVIETPTNGNAIGHCLLLEENGTLVLVDTGIGLIEAKDPEGRIGQPLIDIVGFKFNEEITAIRQIEKLGYAPTQVSHCIITHLDPDHAGGLADFPTALVHVSTEEVTNFKTGNQRYLPIQLAHDPEIITYSTTTDNWFGLEARKVALSLSAAIYLIPLFGHTLGHCGVAIQQHNKWLLHVGDAYYLRAETDTDEHPVTQLATMRADDNTLRIQSLTHVKRLLKDHGDEIEIMGYHDPEEFFKLNSRHQLL